MRSAVLVALGIIVAGAVAHPWLMAPGPSVAPAAENAPVPAPLDSPSPPIQPSTTIVDYRGVEGFWRVGRTAQGVWWFISPTGGLEFLNTVTTVVPYQLGRDATGPHYISRDWGDEPHDAAGDLHEWARRTLARVREAGFKGLGAWCHPVFHNYDVPITRDLNLWTWVAADCRRLYSPHWTEHVEAAVVRQVTPLRDNRNLVGYFLDNELDWGDSGAGPGFYFDHLQPDDPNRAQVMAVIRQLWPTIEAFNADWNTEVSGFDELRAAETLPQARGDAYGRLMSAWLEHLARDYFQRTTQLVRKHDPNHLILGVRFKGYAPIEVVRASRGLTDVVSINYYVADGRLDLDMFRAMNEASGQPVMVTEYSFHALDGRSGNRNTFGFAAQVLDQQARADGYRLFTTRLARVPYVIGADWFQWSDEPPSGRTVDGEDVNFGIVDVDDRAYDGLTAAVREVAPQLNGYHGVSHADDHAGVWRERPAVRPSIRVPYLASPPRLNGELSDWPDAARVREVRRGHAIGSDRVAGSPPVILAGWNAAGVYLAFEVFDGDVQAAPATGAWWTRDNVEFWISTRPVASDQLRYDVNCHQFFFVPIAFPGSDGVAGVVGQWHRPGDALDGHLIPHPLIRSAARVLPDRYVVEIFLPVSALHGFNPDETRELAINFNVHNFQHASNFYFSAAKESLTQLRPNTWGIAHLLPAPESTASSDE